MAWLDPRLSGLGFEGRICPFSAPPNPQNSPCPGLSRASTSSVQALSEPRKTWVAGSSPATGYLWLRLNALLQPDSLNRTAVGSTRGSGAAAPDAHGSSPWAEG